jgi:undecaprenyl-diphosphatase
MLANLDTTSVTWLATHRVGWLNDAVEALSAAGTLGALWVALAFALSRRIAVTVATAVVVVATDALAGLLRDWIDRPRPFAAHRAIHVIGIHPHSPSFPSGHAATGFAAVAFLAVVLGRARVLWILVPAALVGSSRVYLGAHYPSDVFAGAALGLVVGAVCGLAAKPLARRLGLRVTPGDNTAPAQTR